MSAERERIGPLSMFWLIAALGAMPSTPMVYRSRSKPEAVKKPKRKRLYKGSKAAKRRSRS